jgi:tRNA pseudouridine55 synthase
MIGVINLDKPVGPTSHDMVGLIRRLCGLRRIGHAGTLDPLASGVLPILVGPATRLSQELTGGRKRYDAVVRLGVRSETDDAEGPIAPGGPPPDEDAVRAAIPTFEGTFEQRPPAFSARKAHGVVAYQAARRGTALDLAPREVTIHAIRLLDLTPGDGFLDVHLDVETGAGTYIRSLARDLGERLGSGGYLHALRRTEAAGLSVDESHPPGALEALAAEGRLDEALIPVDGLLQLPLVTLDPEQAGRFSHGGEVAWPGEGRIQVHGPNGLLGIGELGAGRLRPRTVLAETGYDAGD